MNPKGFADTLGMLCHHRWRASWARGLFDLEGAANRAHYMLIRFTLS